MTTGVDTIKFIKDMYSKPIIWNRNCTSNKAMTEKTWIELSKKYRTTIPILKAKWKGLRDMFRVEIKRIPRNDAGEIVVEPHEYDSKWGHYKSLLFLVDHMRSRNSQLNLINPIQNMDILDPYSYMVNGYAQDDIDRDGDGDDDDSDIDSNIFVPMLADKIKTEPADLIEKQQKEIFKRKLSSNSPSLDEDVTFVVPEFNKINKRRKMSMLESSATTSENNDKVINDDYHFLMSLQPFMSELNPSQKLRLRMKIQKLVFDELYGSNPEIL